MGVVAGDAAEDGVDEVRWAMRRADVGLHGEGVDVVCVFEVRGVLDGGVVRGVGSEDED